MKSQTVLLSLAGATSLVALACQPTHASDSSSPVGSFVEMQNRVNVTRLYNENCANCHGENGQGGGAGTNTLLTEEQFHQKFDKPYFDAIKNGVEDMGMEAFGDSMTDEQIWGLVVHIRELQGRALRAKNGSPTATNGVYSSKYHKYRIETVVDTDQGLKTPWAVDWLPDGTMLVTNRPGFMTVFKDGKKLGNVSGIPDTVEIGQGGLMDVAVHPNYAENGWIYLGLADPGDNGAMTKIVRGKLKIDGSNYSWTNNETLFTAPASSYSRAGVHYGNRIVFDGKGNIFFSIGERGQQDRAQQLDQPNGKIFRIKENGEVPADNPFVNTPGALKSIWSYGHRNPQGLAIDQNGVLWDTEHGPRGGDEVNKIVKGDNYGWPVVAFSINYNDTPDWTPWPKSGQNIHMPAFRWIPSIGACGLDVGRGGAFPEWENDLLAGGLSGQNVDRIRVNGDNFVEREELVHGMGRVRDVMSGPDGTVYVVLNGPDKVIRLTPAD